MDTRFKILTTKAEVRQLVRVLRSKKIACVDFETNGEPIYTNSFFPTILSVSYQSGSSIIIPLAHQDSPFRKSWLSVLRLFGRAIIENPSINKVAQNWKFDNQIFRKYNIYSRGYILDTMLMKHILNEERPHGLKEMVDKYLPEHSGYELDPEFKRAPWSNKPFEPLCRYASIDTDMTLRLAIFMENKLLEQPVLYRLYRNQSIAASTVLQSVEAHGLQFDKEMNQALHPKYEKAIEESYNGLSTIKQVARFIKIRQKERIQQYIETIEEEIRELQLKDGSERSIKNREEKLMRVLAKQFTTKKELALIEPLNFNSTKQLIELVFTHPKGLKYPILEYTKDAKTKRPSENPSTSEDTLLKLLEYDKYGFVKKLLDYRGLEHTYSSFIKGYAEIIQDDNRIHPIFNIHGTTSGRLSSSKPNAQQIPKKEVCPDIKPQFIAPPGKLYLMLDYSQAELRVMAHLAGDESLLKAFRDGKDLHLTIACKKYGFDYDKILPIYLDETHKDYVTWKVRRKNAKLTVFGLIYGIESKKLAQQLSDIKLGIIVTPEQAQKEIDEFFALYPKILKFITKTHKQVERDGYVTSLFGRKRRLPKIYSDKYGEYLEAKRNSVNFKCQSAATDMTLFASILIHWMVQNGELPKIQQCSTVHDSLYYYVNPLHLNPWVIWQVFQICKNPETKKYFNFKIDNVDMAMDFGVGRNMSEELPYIPGYDYNKLFSKSFNKDEYYKEHSKVKSISIEDYPKEFPQYFTREAIKNFKEECIRQYNN